MSGSEEITKDEQMRIAESMQKSELQCTRDLGDFLVKIGLGDAMTVKQAWPNTWAKHSRLIKTEPEKILQKLQELLDQQEKLIERIGKIIYTEKDAES